ncbi:hypothetical protein C4K14_3988 [Pseudomonas chlororaphis subsp. aureofaciens]|uniref:cupin domain-containing protein n=1 Tax=Pseudomonas chlororaphis TaxID=587753 RepID=UPI000F58E31B|nr:cupin domain-containing protein [Pseudomonas chlororaphis]AZD86810.1 hypothetical protein C4K14_3988 [Pseudomonas chlororaphis subsp. aureofaciens]
MGKINIQDLTEHNIKPDGSARARFIHTEHCTLAFWNLEKGAVIPLHRHHHEACPIVMKGKLQLLLDGVPHVLTEGQCAVVESDVAHEAIALEACEILEIYSPVREDYQKLDFIKVAWDVVS